MPPADEVNQISVWRRYRDILVYIIGLAILAAVAYFFIFTPSRSLAAERISLGYIYNEQTGAFVTGSVISVVGPGAVTILNNGSASGTYDFITDGTPGSYTLTVTPPAGYIQSQTCLEQTQAYIPPLAATTNTIGSAEGATGFLADNSCGANPYYFEFYLTGADTPIVQNNIPLRATSTFSGYDMSASLGSYFGVSGGNENSFDAIETQDGNFVYVFDGATNVTTNYGSFTKFGGADTSNGDIIVAKFTPTGAILWGTLIGGGQIDFPLGVEEDSSGNLFISGYTLSSDFPTTTGAFDTSYNGGGTGGDGILVKLSSDGSTILASTYLGSTQNDDARSIAFASDDSLYVSGFTLGSNLMANSITGSVTTTHNSYNASVGSGSGNGWVAQIDNDLSNVSWLRYIGSPADTLNDAEFCEDVEVAPDNDIVVVCNIHGTGASTTPGAYQTTYGGGNNDLYVVRMTSDGSTYDYATYLGGSGDEYFPDSDIIRVDSSDLTHVVGYSISTNFPTTTDAYDGTINSTGGGDVTYSVFSSTGSLNYSTYFGHSSGYTFPDAMDITAEGYVAISMQAAATGLPTTTSNIQSGYGGGARDTYLLLFSSSTGVIAASYYGSTGNEEFRGGYIDSRGGFLVSGQSTVGGFPVTAGVYQSSHSNSGAEDDAFFARITLTDTANAGITVVTSSISALTEGSSTTTSYDIVLDTEPTSTVQIILSPTADLSISTTTITFTQQNWYTTTTVTVSTTDDSTIDGDHIGQIAHTVSSTNIYSNIPAYAVRTVSISDDDSASLSIIGTSTVSSFLDEDGTISATYTIALSGAPTSSFSVVVTSSDDQVVLSTTSIYFTSSTWNTPVTVTTTANDDSLSEGFHYSTTTITVSSSYTNFGTLGSQFIAFGLDDNEITREVTTTISGGDTTVSESGLTDSFSLVLTRIPTSTVTVAVTSTQNQLIFSSSSVYFSALNWSVPVDITVSAIDDLIAEGSHTDTITLLATSVGTSYDGISTNVAATILDDDTAGVTISESSVSITEGGSGSTHTLVLNTRPTNTVSIAITTSTTDIAVSTTTLTFNSSTWNTALTVTTTAPDDSFGEGTQTAFIYYSVTSVDPNYNGTEVVTTTVTVTDDETVGITYVSSGGTLAEASGNSATYTVALASQPTSTVTIAISADADSSISTSSIIFTSSTWNVPITVTSTVVDDAEVEGTHSTTITHTSTQTGSSVWNNATPTTISFTITDDDVSASSGGGFTTLISPPVSSVPTIDPVIVSPQTPVTTPNVSPIVAVPKPRVPYLAAKTLAYQKPASLSVSSGESPVDACTNTIIEFALTPHGGTTLYEYSNADGQAYGRRTYHERNKLENSQLFSVDFEDQPITGNPDFDFDDFSIDVETRDEKYAVIIADKQAAFDHTLSLRVIDANTQQVLEEREVYESTTAAYASEVDIAGSSLTAFSVTDPSCQAQVAAESCEFSCADLSSSVTLTYEGTSFQFSSSPRVRLNRLQASADTCSLSYLAMLDLTGDGDYHDAWFRIERRGEQLHVTPVYWTVEGKFSLNVSFTYNSLQSKYILFDQSFASLDHQARFATFDYSPACLQ